MKSRPASFHAGKEKWFQEVLVRRSTLVAVLLLLVRVQAVRADADLRALYDSKQFFALRDVLKSKRDDRSDESLFYRGVVDNKFNNLKESIARLERYRGRAKDRPSDPLLKECYELLADGYLKTYRYGRAAETYRELLERFRGTLPAQEAASFENVARLWGALADAPAQTVSLKGDTRIAPVPGTFGLRVPVEANGQTITFLMDTGANLSTIAASVAQKLGVRVIDAPILVGSITGAKVEARPGVAPELKIGNATVRNAVFLVFDDKHLSFPNGFRIDGLVGFPVIAGLGEVTFARSGEVTIPARPTLRGEPNLFLDGLKPYVSVEYQGRPMTFAFDTGASNTDLYVPFFKAFESDITSRSTQEKHRFAGVGGGKEVNAYILKDVTFRIADKEARLTKAPVFTEVTHEDGKLFHGNLGQDVIRQFDRMTLNFRTMRLVFE
jgi:hypothetical protein